MTYIHYTYYTFLTFALFYTAAILFLRVGLHKVEKDNKSVTTSKEPMQHFFSIVIAAHNEEQNIASCLNSIFDQTLSQEFYEVIVVNDRSSDKTPDILNDFATRHKNLKVITITKTPHGLSPKKHAVSQGIAVAANDIIIFTDADCQVPQTWLATISKYFLPNTGLVQGITSYKYIDGMNKLFFGLQATDFLSHGIVAAAAIGANLPINSNANNFAFRKSAFEEVGGYGNNAERIISGDDDLLLQRIWKPRNKTSRKWQIRFMSDPAGSVNTAPTETAAKVFEQRKRWGSKTVHYHASQVALLSSVFIFYLMTAASFVLPIFNLSYLPLFAAMQFVKLAGEMILMIPGTRMFDKLSLRKYIIPASLIQLPLVLCAILFGVFGKFDWRGQRLSRSAT